MNFLGHMFLSPNDDELRVGNFIADSVKGNPYGKLPERISDGVMLHRMIDGFTDAHPLVKDGVARLRATQGRYAPVVLDVLYDHVLASNWNDHHTDELMVFSERTYDRLGLYENHFPAKVKRYFPYMREQNWLFNYQFQWGLIKSLQELDRRSSIQTEMHRSVEVFVEYEEEFRSEFNSFILDISKAVSDYSETGRLL